MESFNDTPVGATSDTSGDSQGCRMYHLGAAMNDAALHCDHAAGLAVCVAPMETTMSPTDTPMNNMTAAGMFCMAYAQTCANYPAFSDQKGCMESFYNTPLGEMSDTAGDSQGCRRYHLGAAKGNPALHCDHAAGLAVCVAKTTGAPEGSPSEEFCDNYFLTEGVCNAYNSYSTKAACVKDYKLTPLGNKNDQVGNTRACREYHISVAPSGPMFHCPHAAGDSICVGKDPTDPGEKFCQGFEAVCNKFNPYNDTQSCVTSFKNTPEGNTQDDSGNSQGCRNYHLGAALGNAALHCPHAAGMAVCVGESSS